MDQLKAWPQAVAHYLQDNFGRAEAVETLTGIKAEGGCTRVRFPRASVVVKQADHREYAFYTRLAPGIPCLAEHIPRLLAASSDKGFWLVLEDIPHLLPRERWQGDEQVLAVLARLHRGTWGRDLPLAEHYLPRWGGELALRMLEMYPGEKAREIKTALAEARQLSSGLFLPHCWISADTNPTNWGLRTDGTPVLFDWERISLGSPAIDLAITLPGLGSEDFSLERQIAKTYLALWKERPFREEELFQAILLAKLWSVLEFLAYSANLLPREQVDAFLTRLPQRLYGFLNIVKQ